MARSHERHRATAKTFPKHCPPYRTGSRPKPPRNGITMLGEVVSKSPIILEIFSELSAAERSTVLPYILLSSVLLSISVRSVLFFSQWLFGYCSCSPTNDILLQSLKHIDCGIEGYGENSPIIRAAQNLAHRKTKQRTDVILHNNIYILYFHFL